MPRVTRSSTSRSAVEDAKEEPQQLSSPPATPASGKKGKAQAKAKPSSESRLKAEIATSTPTKNQKRSRRSTKQEFEGDVNDLPHNLGTALPTPGAEEYRKDNDSPPSKRRKRSSPKESVKDPSVVKDEFDEEVVTKQTPKKTPKKANYGLTPGISPYPHFLHPTPEECQEVVRLLEKVHGKVVAPKAVPPPSLDVSGCGEVPSVLDALVRTRLSANTTNKNSSTAFQGLVSRFGILKEGIGKGSVDWDAVRRAPQKEVFKAIERGGLADRKSKDIQAILQMAYDENQERKAALTNPSSDLAGVKEEPEDEKREEVAKASQNIISLDHLHLLSTNDAIEKMLTYPGIGPKTASCVALFCLQRPSFAVDTHVFRLCQYLNWVPKSTKKGEPRVDRNTAYSHCDALIPDEYKYPLHQLLIRHGKVCPRCRAITGQTSANWNEGCPIEHLVKRHGAKKGGISVQDRKAAKEAAVGDGLSGSNGEDGQESDLSELGESGDEE